MLKNNVDNTLRALSDEELAEVTGGEDGSGGGGGGMDGGGGGMEGGGDFAGSCPAQDGCTCNNGNQCTT